MGGRGFKFDKNRCKPLLFTVVGLKIGAFCIALTLSPMQIARLNLQNSQVQILKMI